MFMSVKLDRLTVGTILKQEMVFLISVRSVRTMSSYPANGRYIILLVGFAEDPFNERAMDGH
jgi:hypothetical protein